MKKNKFINKFLTNIYVKNLLLMAIVFIGLVYIVLFSLDIYTKHNKTITVPDLLNLQVSDANAIIGSTGLKCEVVDSVYDKSITPGAIVDQVPRANSIVKEGRTVYLIIQSQAEQLVAVPDLEDYSQRQAIALLNSLGFTNIQIEQVPSEYEGLVVSVEFKGNSLKAGYKVPKGATLRMKVGAGGGSLIDSDSIQ